VSQYITEKFVTLMKTRMSRGCSRPVAGREQILKAARAIGVREGWKCVTIRAVAQKLGYTAPLLYEHFRDKEDIFTQLAIQGQLSLAKELAGELPKAPRAAVLLMVERYWFFMLKNKQVYRLMNGMDGVPIDRKRVGSIPQGSFEAAKAVLRAWLNEENAKAYGADVLLDELWAVLHGMAALYLDRSAAFDLGRAQDCVAKLLMGTRVQAQSLRGKTARTIYGGSNR
jgi:AcrR family transcriptional regulator